MRLCYGAVNILGTSLINQVDCGIIANSIYCSQMESACNGYLVNLLYSKFDVLESISKNKQSHLPYLKKKFDFSKP